MLVDCAVVLITFVCATWFYALVDGHQIGFFNNSQAYQLAVIMTVLLPVFVISNMYAQSYSVAAIQSVHVSITRVFHAWVVTISISLLFFYSSKLSGAVSRGVFLTAAFVTPVVLMAVRAVAISLIAKHLRRPIICQLFIRSGGAPEALSSTELEPFDTICAETMALRPNIYDPIALHNFSCLIADYDRVVVACPAENRKDWALYMQSVGCVGDLLVPEFEGVLHSPLSKFGSRLPTVRVSVGPLELPDRILKRVLDLSLTVPAIIALSPVMLLVAIAIKLDSRGPVLFRQRRMGRSNRLFNVYKFRSMRHEQSDFSGDRSASRDDDRITRVGRIIRATSIDELPQLFNVLEGDMALVGPRPHALGSRAGDDLFWDIDHRYWLRHSIKPGITGLAQVRGYRGATDHRDDLINRLRSDLEYVSDWSIGREIVILLRTVGVVIHKKAY